MKYLPILFLLLYTSVLYSQTPFVERSGSNYIFDGKTYKCNELGQVYIEFADAYELYTAGIKSKKVANVIGIVGLPFMAAGIVGFASATFEGAIYGVLFSGVGIVIELIALIPRARGSAKLRKARKTFNFEMIKRHGYESETSLVLGATSNGIGLIYQF